MTEGYLTITLRLPASLKVELHSLAHARRTSLNQLVVDLLTAAKDLPAEPVPRLLPMTDDERSALEWSLQTDKVSVAARNAQELAKYIAKHE